MKCINKLYIHELEERIAPSALGNPGNNNPGENNTNLQGNQPGDGGGGGGNSSNNNPGENNTNNSEMKLPEQQNN